jgi:hypothetical protein
VLTNNKNNSNNNSIIFHIGSELNSQWSITEPERIYTIKTKQAVAQIHNKNGID